MDVPIFCNKLNFFFRVNKPPRPHIWLLFKCLKNLFVVEVFFSVVEDPNLYITPAYLNYD